MPELILIVDDEAVQRRLLEAAAAASATSDDCGRRRCGDRDPRGPDGGRFDAVILDLVMPDLDGYGVLARMRDMGLGIPVIVQTAHGGIERSWPRCVRARWISW